MKEVIYAQEVRETTFNELSPKIEALLSKRVCENCQKELDRAKIHYLLTQNGKVVWWHEWRCGA